MFGRSNKNQNNHSKTNGYNGHRTRSNVLAQLPIWTIIFFYMRAVPVACYVIIKWLVQFIWKTLRQSPDSKRDGNDMRHIDYYDGAHDKPPPCLVDNRIGLQSYVKLKVYIISIALLLWSSTIGKTRPKTHRHSKEEKQKKKIMIDCDVWWSNDCVNWSKFCANILGYKTALCRGRRLCGSICAASAWLSRLLVWLA